MKNCWFVKVYTEYSGTDSTCLVFDSTREEVEEEARDMARDNAESFSYIWMDEDIEDFDSEEEYWEVYNEREGENTNYEVVEFDIEEHEGYLYKEEIDNYNKWKNGSN